MKIGPQGLMHPDYLAALQSMPRAPDGTVKDLHYVPPAQVPAYEAKWREWCRAHPDKSQWPLWLHKWAEGKKRGRR